MYLGATPLSTKMIRCALPLGVIAVIPVLQCIFKSQYQSMEYHRTAAATKWTVIRMCGNDCSITLPVQQGTYSSAVPVVYTRGINALCSEGRSCRELRVRDDCCSTGMAGSVRPGVSLLRASSCASAIVNAPLRSALTIVPWRVGPLFADQHAPRITQPTHYGMYVHPTLFTHVQRGRRVPCVFVGSELIKQKTKNSTQASAKIKKEK
jgi:hypothetical protein